MNTAEKCPAVEEFSVRDTYLETLWVLPEHGTDDTVNRIGEWSEKNMAQISLTETEIP